jgi:hypothetical protein
LALKITLCSLGNDLVKRDNTEQVQALKKIILFFTLLFPIFLLAWPPMFGPEWEFTNYDIRGESYQPDKASRDLYLAIVKKCKQTKLCRGDSDQQKIIFKNGYWMNISADDKTIEVQAKPYTTEEFKKVKNLVQTHLFDVAKKEGFLPHSKKWGAGQIHFDRYTSGMTEDGKLLRNFLVDFFNHWEIGTGVLEFDNDNAKVVALESSERKIKIRSILQPSLKHNNSEKLNGMVQEVLSGRNFALNLSNVDTLEVRSLRMQESADDYLKMTTLLEARINWLRNQKDNIPLQNWNVKNDDLLMARMFQAYVEETGLSWKDYAPLVPKEYRSVQKIKYDSLDPSYQVKEVKQFKEQMFNDFSTGQSLFRSDLTKLVISLKDDIKLPVMKQIAQTILSTDFNTIQLDSQFDSRLTTLADALAASRNSEVEVTKVLLRLGEEPKLNYSQKSLVAKKLAEYLHATNNFPTGEDQWRVFDLSHKTVNAELSKIILPLINEGNHIQQKKLQKILSEQIGDLLVKINYPMTWNKKRIFEQLKTLSIKASKQDKLLVQKALVDGLDLTTVDSYEAAYKALIDLRPLEKETLKLLKKKINIIGEKKHAELLVFSPCKDLF